MHLAYFHYLSGGDTATHHVRQFVEAARSLGHRVDVYGLDALGPALPDSGVEEIVGTKAPGTRPLARYLHAPKEFLRNGYDIWRETRLLRGNRPDVLLVRLKALTASCGVVSRRLDLPLVIEMNAPVAEGHLYRPQYVHLPWLSERLAAHALRRADAITAVSSALRSYLVEQYALPEQKITVVPNGADVGRFRPDTCPDTGLPEKFRQNVVVGFVGSFQRFHGPELLARMALRVAEARPLVHFLLVGEGSQLEVVSRMTDPIQERVLLTRRVAHERVPGLVAAFDVAVLAETAFYCSPLKVIEWMAAGRAVVAPAYGPLEEVIESGREGLLFPPGDEDALVESVLALVDDPERRAELGARAAARVRGSLTWQDNARRVIAACQRAAAGH